MSIGKTLVPFLVLCCAPVIAWSQSAPFRCAATAVPVDVRAEGLTEKMGDIILSCSGGTSGAAVAGNLTVFLTVNITNRVDTSGVTDVLLMANTGAGPAPTGVPGQLLTPTSLVFNGLNLALPASGRLELRITNLRGAATLAASSAGTPIQAFLGFSDPRGLPVDTNEVVVARVQPGLLASAATTQIRCTGSPLPSTITLANLFAVETRFSSLRVTEGFAASFEKKDTYDDTGTRIIVRYAGFPGAGRIFLPNVIAGSSAVEPTSGGDLGFPQSGGKYSPTIAGSLLLVRVPDADRRGAGGTPVYTPGAPGSGTVALDTAGEVTLANGSGYAVYEVMDSNPSVIESAHIPTFLGLASIRGGTAPVATAEVFFAPVSTERNASATEPAPRFAAVAPGSDCRILQDCESGYFPKLTITAPPLVFSALAGSFGWRPKYVQVHNKGGGVMSWTASVTYKNGSGWLMVDPPSGINGGGFRIDALPQKLEPGIYEAEIVIDAGPFAGSRTLPVHFTVTALPPNTDPVPPPASPAVEIASVTNGATFAPGPLSPGSIGTIKGSNLAGNRVSVAFDGIAADLLYTSADQINFVVPAELASKSEAQLVVTVDDRASAPRAVALAAIAPGIFAGGILNQDNSRNGSSTPAEVGSVIQIFITGLVSSETGRVWVKIHDRDQLVPLYADRAPGLPGVDQVNARIPFDLPAMTTEVVICASPAADTQKQFCTPPAPLTLK